LADQYLKNNGDVFIAPQCNVVQRIVRVDVSYGRQKSGISG